MQENFEQHIDQNYPFLDGKKLLVACSGGLDSVVLSWLLKKMNYNISIAHCNFSLRANESDEDEKFVIDLADKLSVPIFFKKFDTKNYKKINSVSTQMAARELRYTWFEELCNTHNFDYLLTAHHLDDDLETFLINLSRGTGLKGLLGIPEFNNKIVRPLLRVPRNEILQYAKENKIKWREDSSNQSTDYLRNKLRLDVIPKLKEANENIIKGFQKTSNHLKDSQSLVDDYMQLIKKIVLQITDEGIEIDIIKLQELPNTNALLYELLAPYRFTAWEDVYSLLEAQTGKQIFSDDFRLIKNRNSLLLIERSASKSEELFYIEKDIKFIESPIELKMENVEEISEFIPNIAYLDVEKLVFPLKLRKWIEGDYFFPFGMKGKKKLSKFFKDEKLSLVAKEKIWVLLSKNDIVWVVGLRTDNRYKIDDKTKNVLKITYLQK